MLSLISFVEYKCKCQKKLHRFLFHLFIQIIISPIKQLEIVQMLHLILVFYSFFFIFCWFDNCLALQGNGISPIKQLGKATGPVYGKTITHQNVTSNGKDLHQFQTYTYSPVSVFESSSSSSVENSNFDRPVIPVKQARSKRQHPSNFSPL